MRLVLVVLAVAVWSSSCNTTARVGPSGHAPAPIAAASTDPLWAFAPADVDVGVVIADGALASLHGGARRVVADLEKAPGGAAVVATLREKVAALPFDPLDPAALAAMGVDLAKGAAFFVGPSGTLAVFPVVDARKLLARFGGSSDGGIDRIDGAMCRTMSGRYVCAETRAALDGAGKRNGAGLLASWPKGLRGHIEVFVSPRTLGGVPWISASRGLRAAAVLERGAATVRAHWKGSPAGPLRPVRGGRNGLTAGIADEQPAGLFLVNGAATWRAVKDAQAAKLADQAPLPGGVTVPELAASWTGDMVVYALPGRPARGLWRMGLSDEEPARRVVSRCGEGAPLPPGVTMVRKGDRCVTTADLSAVAGSLPGLGAFQLEQWIEPGVLVVRIGDHAIRATARPSLAPFARELLDGEWLFAAWGRGVTAAGPLSALIEANDPTGRLATWSLRHLNETGAAVNVTDDGIHAALRIRTLWANPDDVVAAVHAAMTGPAPRDAPARLQRVAAEHPDSLFGRDMQADPAGLSVQFAVVGMLAGVAVPAFMKYIKQSKSVAASVAVRNLYLAARAAYMNGPKGRKRFPGPSAGPTPPLGECCRQGGKCAPDPGRWQADPWRSLHFSVDDADYYSYEYKVTGNPGATDGSYGFTVLAHGDLDCDGVYSTLSMHGQIDQANPDGPTEAPALERTDELE